MVKKSQLLTQDISEFLDAEYKSVFKRVFKDQESFEKIMRSEAIQCSTCKCWYWKATTKPCDCNYQAYLKRITNDI